MSADRIAVRGVRCWAAHGVLDQEKVVPQPFDVDVEVDVDTAAAGAHDDLDASVSYALLAQDVVQVLSGPPVDLLETLAARVAEAALARPLVEAATVTVHKPHAPVGAPFTDAAVTVRRERSVPVVVALGANLGNAPRTLALAVRSLTGPGGPLRDACCSDLVVTDPVGGPEQPDYVNAVVTAVTSRPARLLLADLHAVEARFGRTRDVRWGARTLDLDLVAYGDTVSDDPHLTLPHPRAHERGFVLVPWLDADPAATLAVDGESVAVADLLDRVGRDGVRPGPAWPVLP